MAALAGKLEADVEVKSPASRFFKRITSELNQVPDASPEKVHGFELHEGDHWSKHGSVKLWSYTIDGVKEELKEKLEVDEASKTMAMVAVGGHILEKYKSLKIQLQVVPKGENAVVKISLPYEKINENHDDPHNYLRFVAGFVKDIDQHLIAQK